MDGRRFQCCLVKPRQIRSLDGSNVNLQFEISSLLNLGLPYVQFLNYLLWGFLTLRIHLILLDVHLLTPFPVCACSPALHEWVWGHIWLLIKWGILSIRQGRNHPRAQTSVSPNLVSIGLKCDNIGIRINILIFLQRLHCFLSQTKSVIAWLQNNRSSTWNKVTSSSIFKGTSEDALQEFWINAIFDSLVALGGHSWFGFN